MATLSEKVCVLVGGGGGIGAATALAYAREGATVVVADINGDLAEAAVVKVREAGGEAWSTRIDVLAAGELDALIDEVVGRHGGIDVLHNLTSTTVLVPSTCHSPISGRSSRPRCSDSSPVHRPPLGR